MVSLMLVVGSLAVGIYVATRSSPLDSFINKPIPSSLYARLQQASAAPYGPDGSDTMTGVKTIGGPPYQTSDGLPVVVYVGANYCLYCAITRWSLVISLMRFGTFTGLEYMTSSPAEGDYATFTFQSASYQSEYVAFRGYEVQDRDGNALATLPSGYSSSFTTYGMSATPFTNFANEYFVLGALADPRLLGTKDWDTVVSEIGNGGTVAAAILGGANVMTAAICNLTNGAPASVCQSEPIHGMTTTLAGSQTPEGPSFDLLGSIAQSSSPAGSAPFSVLIPNGAAAAPSGGAEVAQAESRPALPL